MAPTLQVMAIHPKNIVQVLFCLSFLCWSLDDLRNATVLGQPPNLGHTPSTAGTFRKRFRKNSGKTPETLSERFLEFPSRVRLGCPKPYNSRHLRLPERFQNSLPPSTAGDASFFRIGSGEGLSELVMEFPAVLGVFLKTILTSIPLCARTKRFSLEAAPRPSPC